jgi:hypothetical protein
MSDIKVYNVRFAKGTTWKLAFTWSDKDPVTLVKTPKNLTGYSAKLQIRRNGTVVLTTSTALGTITLGGVAGTVVSTASATLTDAIEAGSAEWAIELTSGGGEVTEVLRGQAYIEAEIAD